MCEFKIVVGLYPNAAKPLCPKESCQYNIFPNNQQVGAGRGWLQTARLFDGGADRFLKLPFEREISLSGLKSGCLSFRGSEGAALSSPLSSLLSGREEAAMNNGREDGASLGARPLQPGSRGQEAGPFFVVSSSLGTVCFSFSRT